MCQYVCTKCIRQWSLSEVHIGYRAETILSGVIIRPVPDDPTSTRLSMMFQTDMKGWIPHFLTNAFAARSPGNWKENLTSYYWNVYSKQQGKAGDGSSEAAKSED